MLSSEEKEPKMRLLAVSQFGVALVALCCIHGAFGASDGSTKIFGDRFYHPKSALDYLQTYVIIPYDYSANTTPIAVGVEFTDGFIGKATRLPIDYTIIVPIPNATKPLRLSSFDVPATFFPVVGSNPFSFLYWSYHVYGHEPPGVYDVPHFDFHFMFPSYEYWWIQEWPESSHGPCMGGNKDTFFKAFKPYPEGCWPGKPDGPVRQVGNFVWGMGSHLIDESAPEFRGNEFNYTQIYGQYNGAIQYFESMVSLETLKKTDLFEECIELQNNPTAMSEARDIPYQMCVGRRPNASFVEYRNFKPVSAGCGGGKLVGNYPNVNRKACPVVQLPRKLH